MEPIEPEINVRKLQGEDPAEPYVQVVVTFPSPTSRKPQSEDPAEPPHHPDGDPGGAERPPGAGEDPAEPPHHPDPPGRTRNPMKVLLVAVGVLALFAAGLLAGTLLSGDGNDDSQPSQSAAETAAAEEPSQGAAETAAAEKPAIQTQSGAGDSAAPQPTGTFYNPFTGVDYGSGLCAPSEGAAEAVLDFDDAPALCIDTSGAYTAVFDTTQGLVEVALDAASTPGTVNNFVNLARYGYYDNTLIHRSDPSIGILQGGSPRTNDPSDPGPGYTIWDEGSGFTYRPGLLAMARTDNPNSADAQFFFTVTDAASLLDAQGDSVVFGQVTAGLDVLTAILNTHQTQPGNNFGGIPNPPVTINTITIRTQ
ncbi:MAG: peptidylprolyl isomerase [bacterium]|nr:peptidylprolyl isomerase [bacterium]